MSARVGHPPPPSGQRPAETVPNSPLPPLATRLAAFNLAAWLLLFNRKYFMILDRASAWSRASASASYRNKHLYSLTLGKIKNLQDFSLY